MMRPSSPSLALGAAFAVLTMVGGCSNAKAQVVMPESTPLAIPAAPPRVVVPPAPELPPVAVETRTAAAAISANPPATSSRPNRDPRPLPPPANPPAATPLPALITPATPLETQANQSELERTTRALLASANGALEKINYQTLSADGKAQYDAAKRFTKQSDDALKAKNIVYAWQLADKANTIATLLSRHSENNLLAG